MDNSRRWKSFITWWRVLDDTDYGDQYALIKAINDKIKEIQQGEWYCVDDRKTNEPAK